MGDTEVRWAEIDGTSIAYEVFGTGPIDLLLGQMWSPIDLMWELPQLASFLDQLGAMARVIALDTLGSGASDRVVDRYASTGETFSDASLAVLDAVNSPRAVLLDTNGLTGPIFAAMFPQRIHKLIVVNLRTSFPELRAMTRAQRERFARLSHGIRSLEVANPRVAHDPALRQWWERARRLRATREDTRAQVEWAANADIESILPTVRVPTLVLHRRDNPMFDIETSRAAAQLIPNAQFVELPGSESDLFLGDSAPVFAELDRFLRTPDTEGEQHDRPLATVLFTDMVASTEQLAARGDTAWRQVLDDHDQTMDRVVTQYRGRVVKSTGDGILATFDGPARAVRCAQALLDAAQGQGITLRAGLHTGEIEIRPSDLAGIAVHIANRIATLANPNEILVSRTVLDLTTGSGLQFEPRGERELKGVPGTWPIFSARVAIPDAAP